MQRVIIAVVVTNVILFLIAHLLKNFDWHNESGETPVELAVPLSLGAFAIHVYACLRLTDVAQFPQDTWAVVVVFVLVGILPIIAFVEMTVSSITASQVNRMFSWNRHEGRPGTDYSKARTHRARGNMTLAVEEYRRYFRDDQQTPTALFFAAQAYETEGSFLDAMPVYREILGRFPDDDEAWVEAAYSLANILENALNNRAASIYLLRGIVQRQPRSELGRLAGARLMATSCAIAG